MGAGSELAATGTARLILTGLLLTVAGTALVLLSLALGSGRLRSRPPVR